MYAGIQLYESSCQFLSMIGHPPILLRSLLSGSSPTVCLAVISMHPRYRFFAFVTLSNLLLADLSSKTFLTCLLRRTLDIDLGRVSGSRKLCTKHSPWRPPGPVIRYLILPDPIAASKFVEIVAWIYLWIDSFGQSLSYCGTIELVQNFRDDHFLPMF